jgi:hypothetical protein
MVAYVGLDIGTMNLVASRLEQDGRVSFKRERDCFVELPEDAQDAKAFLDQAGTNVVTIDGKMYVVGDAAVNFSQFFNQELKRPMQRGLINPDESELAIQILDVLIGAVLGKPQHPGEDICAACVPAPPINEKRDVVYHKKTIEMLIERQGYRPVVINEAFGAVLSELKETQFSGLAISCGSGMTNSCLCYKGLPVFQFSLSYGGDYIDENVQQATGKLRSEITMLKETELDLTAKHESNILRYLQIYYDDYMTLIIQGIKKAFMMQKYIPPVINAANKAAEALPLVLCGGTSMPKGFDTMFRDKIENTKEFPIKIKKIIIPKEQLYTVANGCLIKAMTTTC